MTQVSCGRRRYGAKGSVQNVCGFRLSGYNETIFSHGGHAWRINAMLEQTKERERMDCTTPDSAQLTRKRFSSARGS